MTYSNLQIFTVELIGTFILVVFATGSIVYDFEFFDGDLGIPFATPSLWYNWKSHVHGCACFTQQTR